MTPDDQRRLNIEHFQGLLRTEADAAKRARIEELLAAERLKPDSAYPREAADSRR